MSALEERFWRHVEVGHPAGCWTWTAAQDGRGYGMFTFKRDNGRDGSMRAHRFAWKCLIGDPDPKLTLDHLCRNTICVNPDHLDEVTHRVNVLRGHGITAKNRKKTHCKHGHEFTEENTRYQRRRKSSGGTRVLRVCRTCAREWMRAKSEAK